MSEGTGDSDTEAGTDAGADEVSEAVVLDFLANGRPGEDRRRFANQPIAYALGEESFQLFELRLGEGGRLGIGDRVAIDPPAEGIERIREVSFDDMTGAARSELEYAVDQIVDDDERRFVDFYNDAQAITTRLHALNLLPGIGKKLRNNILDERKRGPFESFEDLEARVSGLHHPREVLVERIMEELREEDLKYRIFARRKKTD